MVSGTYLVDEFILSLMVVWVHSENTELFLGGIRKGNNGL